MAVGSVVFLFYLGADPASGYIAVEFVGRHYPALLKSRVGSSTERQGVLSLARKSAVPFTCWVSRLGVRAAEMGGEVRVRVIFDLTEVGIGNLEQRGDPTAAHHQQRRPSIHCQTATTATLSIHPPIPSCWILVDELSRRKKCQLLASTASISPATLALRIVLPASSPTPWAASAIGPIPPDCIDRLH